MNQKPDDINSKMEKDEDQEGDDLKPAAQDKSGDEEKKQENDEVSDSEEEEPSKKKRRKESFSLGCQVLQEYIKFDEDEQPVFFENQKLVEKAYEAQERLVE